MARNILPVCVLLSFAISAAAQAQSADAAAPDAGATQPIDAPPAAAAPDASAPPPDSTDTSETEGQQSAAEIRKAREERERRGVALAIKASTLGIGLEGIYSITRHFNVRGQVNFFNYDHSLNKDGNDYAGKLKFLSFGLLGDLYPFARIPVLGDFRLTAGGYVNNNKIDLNAACTSGCNADNLTITSTGTNPAHLAGALSFRSFSPYAGFGFGNAMQGGRFHFAFDIGALFQGKPKVNLEASGSGNVTDNTTGITTSYANVGASPVVASNVANEQGTLSHDVKNFQIYPVIALTFGYRFSF